MKTNTKPPAWAGAPSGGAGTPPQITLPSVRSDPVPTTQSAGELADSAVPYTFAFENLAASVQGTRPIGTTSATIGARMPYAGTVTAITYTSNTELTAGSVLFTVYINSVASQATATWSSLNTGAVVTFNPGQVVFDAEALIYPYATLSAFTPTTADVEVTIYVSFSS